MCAKLLRSRNDFLWSEFNRYLGFRSFSSVDAVALMLGVRLDNDSGFGESSKKRSNAV